MGAAGDKEVDMLLENRSYLTRGTFTAQVLFLRQNDVRIGRRSVGYRNWFDQGIAA
jgi:hypothetical protein